MVITVKNYNNFSKRHNVKQYKHLVSNKPRICKRLKGYKRDDKNTNDLPRQHLPI